MKYNIFKVYRREYKKRFGWIKAGKIEQEGFYAWGEKAREEKARCDNGEISLKEFTKWRKELKSLILSAEKALNSIRESVLFHYGKNF